VANSTVVFGNLSQIKGLFSKLNIDPLAPSKNKNKNKNKKQQQQKQQRQTNKQNIIPFPCHSVTLVLSGSTVLKMPQYDHNFSICFASVRYFGLQSRV